jgi:hypothetical protein
MCQRIEGHRHVGVLYVIRQLLDAEPDVLAYMSLPPQHRIKLHQRTSETIDEIDNIAESAAPCSAVAPARLWAVPFISPAGRPRAGRQSTAPVRMYVEPG